MMTKLTQWLRANKAPILLAAIALTLRIYGNRFGLPDEFSVDEVHLVPRAIRFGTGDLDPHWYFYPPLYMYVLFALYAVYFVIGRAAGLFGGAADFGMQYFLDPTWFYLIGRTCTAVLGAATVWLAYRFGERAWGRAAGICGGLLLALCALHSQNSHYVTTDVPMTFLAMLSLWLAWNFTQTGSRRTLAAASLVAGLAMATKYTGVLLAPAVAVAVAVRWRSRGTQPHYVFNPDTGSLRRAAGGLAIVASCALAGFLIGCPWAVLRAGPFYTDVVLAQGENIKHAGLGMEHIRNMWWHVPSVFLRQGMTLPLLLVCLAGLGWSLWKRTAADIVLAGFTVIFYLWIAHYKNYGFVRYWVAIMPMLCLMGGRLVADVSARITPRHALPAAGLLALVIAAPSGMAALQFGRELSLVDTRTIAANWFCDNVPPGARVALELHDPLLKPTPESVLRDATNPDQFAQAHISETTKFDYLHKLDRPWEKHSATNKVHHLAALEHFHCKYNSFMAFSLAEYPLDMYRRNGLEYLVVNKSIYGRYLAAEDRFPKAAGFYRNLERTCAPAPAPPGAICELAVVFHPRPGFVTGAEIKVYRLLENATEPGDQQ
jgi:hypothetical protein